MDLTLTSEPWPKDASVIVLTVNGDLDVYTTPQFREVLLSLHEDGCRRLVISGDGCWYLDSTGLGAMLAALKRARKAGGGVAIACTRPDVIKVLQITALIKVFIVADTVDEAARSLLDGDR